MIHFLDRFIHGRMCVVYDALGVVSCAVCPSPPLFGSSSSLGMHSKVFSAVVKTLQLQVTYGRI